MQSILPNVIKQVSNKTYCFKILHFKVKSQKLSSYNL